ncbi:kinase [Candidatus Marinamargulisbacteria bacterium SCGC AG-410-N11]|nr:kinase [Candidatus Marinamargulisbacteria bacterium SCGC AG-410-N11]
MIIARVPFRISFFGGGTDFPSWFNHNLGHVISTTINKYCYVTCRVLPPFFDHKYRITYSKIEHTQSLKDIQLAPVREALRFLKETRGMEIRYDADLPARTGLGSSSSFIVGLLHTLKTLHQQPSTKKSLANDAIFLEREILKECVGSQDQTNAAYGGLNYIKFQKDDNNIISPIAISSSRKKELNNHLLLFFTGISRLSSTISQDQQKNLKKNETTLTKMSDLVNQAKDILEKEKDITQFGELLHYTWKLKKSLSSKISSSQIDNLYSCAQQHGAIGGKLLGAGAGGFFLVFAKPEDHQNIIKALSPRIHIPFQFENQGSHIIFQYS